MNDIKATFILLLSVLTTFGQEVTDLKHEQPILKSLFIWDNLLIAERDWVTTDKFYICDTTKESLTRLSIASDTAILDLAETKSFLHAIIKKDNSYFLLTKNKYESKWNYESIFPEFPNLKKFKLVATDNLLVLVTAEKIYSKRPNSLWHEGAVDSLLTPHWRIPFAYMPEHCILIENSLYLGFDNGEWGGSLWEIPISNEKETIFDRGKLVLQDNIVGLEYSSQGLLWVATGLAHLGLQESGIYTYDNSKLQNILWSQPSLSLKEKSDLSAFCLKNTAEPFFAASEFGVFKISNENLEEVLKAKLYLTYRMQHYSVGSRPVGMYVDNNNNIYIAQRSLGVFVYTKTIDSYAFRQMTFD